MILFTQNSLWKTNLERQKADQQLPGEAGGEREERIIKGPRELSIKTIS